MLSGMLKYALDQQLSGINASCRKFHRTENILAIAGFYTSTLTLKNAELKALEASYLESSLLEHSLPVTGISWRRKRKIRNIVW